MCYIVNIYRGVPANNGHESYEFTVKGYKRISGVLVVGNVQLSIVLNDGRKVVVQGYEWKNSRDIAPDKRPFFFSEAIELKIISGVVKSTAKQYISVYLLVE